jgi:predicted GNAT family acetyltransferase
MPQAPLGDIRDDSQGGRFIFEDGGVEAELVYDERPGRLILVHTEVPDALGGRGIGGRLVGAAVARALAEHLTIVPWCPFARRWLSEHPAETADVAVDWDTLPPGVEGSGG